MSNLLLSSLTKTKAGNEVVRGRGKRPSHVLVPVAVAQNTYRIHTRYTFNIGLPNYYYLLVQNQIMNEEDRSNAKVYFTEALKGIFRVIPKSVVIEKVRVNFITQLLEVVVLVEDCLYEAHHMKRLSNLIYESYRSMRDELVRPRWLEYLVTHNVKYRMKKSRYND